MGLIWDTYDSVTALASVVWARRDLNVIQIPDVGTHARLDIWAKQSLLSQNGVGGSTYNIYNHDVETQKRNPSLSLLTGALIKRVCIIH